MLDKVEKGFTLIELMIVVAIIGILASLALPAFGDYMARAQATEGIELMSGFKGPLAEWYASKGGWPLDITSLGGTTVGKYTLSVEGTGAATSYTMTATYRPVGQVNAAIAGKTVNLATTDGGKTWSCVSGGSLETKFRPNTCR